MFLDLIQKHYNAQNLITFIALFLAYLAYRKSIYDDIKNWINLIKSFKSELKYSSAWIGNSYNYPDSKWIDISKIVFPLSFESIKAILQKGHPPFEIISQDFLDKLALFNERVEAFNHILKGQIINYVVSEDKNKKNKVYIDNKDHSEEKAYYLNTILHLNLIGNSQTKASLFYLHKYFEKEVEIILKTWEYKISWFIRFPVVVFILGLIFYLLIDSYL